MKPHAVWYYDIISPYAYLQSASLATLGDALDITARPILLAGVLKHWGQLGPAEIAPKRTFIYRQCLWLAQQRGIPFRMPPGHPFNPLGALRLLTAIDATPAQAATALAFVFGEGNAVDDASGLAHLADRLGVSPALGTDDAAKAALRTATVAAVADGIFGVPTLVVDGQLFWGADSEGMVRAYLADPACFTCGEAVRMATLPATAWRQA